MSRYAVQFFRNVFFKGKLRFLIFFATSRCNCLCETCFYWKELNRNNDLALEEIEKVSASLGEVDTLLLSGGEPFLRQDLFEVCRLFIEKNKISVLSIPTNGLLTDRIVEFSEKIMDKYPRLKLSINPSLDGFRETHDRVRGVPGAFDNVARTMSRLLKIGRGRENLIIAANTVITRKNLPELEGLMDFVFKNFDVTYHDFELLRGDYKNQGLSLPSLEEIKSIHGKIIRNRRKYLARKNSGFFENFAVTGVLALTQAVKEGHLCKKGPFFSCSAGGNIGVIDANGDVRLCELMAPIGNLRECGHDFYSAWKSPKAQEQRRHIIEKRCGCTHVCFINMTLARYLRTIFYLIYYYNKRKK
ncbi:MAG: radical SAM protein [Nitrospinae bacterium]|nr:radical SAM protein [Nitrospinota bacterium]